MFSTNLQIVLVMCYLEFSICGIVNTRSIPEPKDSNKLSVQLFKNKIKAERNSSSDTHKTLPDVIRQTDENPIILTTAQPPSLDNIRSSFNNPENFQTISTENPDNIRKFTTDRHGHGHLVRTPIRCKVGLRRPIKNSMLFVTLFSSS